jgi:DnaK suppressor protein
MKWGKASLAAIKEKLEIERDELGKELKEIEEAAFAASQSEISGEVGYDEDYADAGSATFEREKDLSIYNNVLDLLEKVNKALRKIDDGWYGVCESCGKPITKPRLKALPSVLLCLECKKSEERR